MIKEYKYLTGKIWKNKPLFSNPFYSVRMSIEDVKVF